MGSFWIKDGKIVMEGGKFIVCDECPCTEDDCYADVIAAIRERQGVVGRTVWAADAEKTIAQCVTETNAIAPSFLAGTYSGGASAPTKRTSSYATGTTDFCDLYDLLCALTETVHTAWPSGGERMVGYSGPSYRNTLSEAMAAASTVYGYTRYGLAHASIRVTRNADGKWLVGIEWTYGDIVSSTLSTSLSKTARLFVQCQAGGVGYDSSNKVYNTQGDSWPGSEDYYVLAGTESLSVGTNMATFSALRQNEAPTNNQDPGADAEVVVGYKNGGSAVIVAWSFTHT